MSIEEKLAPYRLKDPRELTGRIPDGRTLHEVLLDLKTQVIKSYPTTLEEDEALIKELIEKKELEVDESETEQKKRTLNRKKLALMLRLEERMVIESAIKKLTVKKVNFKEESDFSGVQGENLNNEEKVDYLTTLKEEYKIKKHQ